MMLILGVTVGTAGLLVGGVGAFTKYKNKTKWLGLALMMAGGACLIFGQ